MRLRPQSRFSTVRVESLSPRLFRMYKGRRCACSMRLLWNSTCLWEGKEAESKLKPSICDSDFNHVFPCYQQNVWALEYSECTRPHGALVGCGCPDRRGALWRKGAAIRRLKLSSHQLHKTQESAISVLSAWSPRSALSLEQICIRCASRMRLL